MERNEMCEKCGKLYLKATMQQWEKESYTYDANGTATDRKCFMFLCYWCEPIFIQEILGFNIYQSYT